jgi:hypothetical protein
MGSIKEPKDVDFYVLGKSSFTPKEEKEFSQYIQKLKLKSKATSSRRKTAKRQAS